ncbi:hypothetical protein DV711_09980 [Motiliproteus coralliicola]|uniref:Uncharacterized protein n=1 Tax=Motiliproteus coralliicola TaxID=2283196 RepID=A0A369WP84_9GAMM|nr:hypothetical protein [Motiliproteus coralliicola]RDE22879.1 hypothetical protein DV711_09980 [Motiliproteus coralliicola]
MDDTIVTLRMIERITVVLIAGVSIFFGYRLFFHLPFERSHEGQLELPGVKIVLSRVGPGIFFAAFGSLVLYYSLTTPIKVSLPTANTTPVNSTESATAQANTPVPVASFTGISGSNAETGAGQATPQQRNRALTSIEALNCAQQLLPADLDPIQQDQLALALIDAKRALLLSVWNEDDWGPTELLGNAGPTPEAPFQLRSLFNATAAECQ